VRSSSLNVQATSAAKTTIKATKECKLEYRILLGRV